ncbi:proton-coupled amino acid transporter-like protein CG1139 [Plodia interpunctella]|uniref:proton-coupled amino acid transporter-like protein CG1139 n=1 Tax=Plodia interpunctella TaxID=58824 RepID=UPI002368C0CD|nr:proton-coupled amino acid transporter-like protein CG1139 [Plodia interpunctella]
MAAFEGVSKIIVKTLGSTMNFVDIRKVTLPEKPISRPPSSRGSQMIIPEDEKTPFNPRHHRDPKKPISPRMAYFNLLRTCFGAGALGLPLAVSQAGMVLGIIICICIGLLIIHTHKMLLECLNEISRQLKIPYISYRYGFRVALLHGPPILKCLGEYGPCIIATFMIMSQLGICSVFVIFTADSLKDIMDWQSINSSLLTLLLPYLLLEFSMKNLSIISHVSMAGNILALVGILLIFYHIFADPHGENFVVNTNPLSILFSIGTFFFNMSAVGVVLSMDKNLLNPEVMVSRYGAINVGGAVAVVVCTIFGALGYWSFGTMEENILRSLPYDDYSAMTAIGLYLIAVGFTYPLQCFPGVQIMVEVIKNYDFSEPISEETLKIFEYIARPMFVVMTFFISYSIPFQGPFVAFVGNLCTTLLSVVFPATMELCLLYPENYGKYRIYFFKNLILIIFGLISWAFGVAFSIYIIYVRLLSAESNEYIHDFI